eukprot:s2113_g3.t1
MTLFLPVGAASLLIAIAQGYSLLSSSLSEVELLVPVVAVVSVLHVALVACGKLQTEDFKYHENEGLVGWILLSVRLSLFAWFRSGSPAEIECGKTWQTSGVDVDRTMTR